MASYDRDSRLQARQHFREARKEAFVNEIRSLLSGEPVDLLSFKEVQRRLGVQTCAMGRLETVPLNKIVGSEGRYQDFDREFLPLHTDTESRWESLDAAFIRMENIPAIELYKVGDVYFVRDGNHRVSVARRHGAEFIDAWVVDCPSRIRLDPGVDVRRLLVEEEHLDFLKRTRLDEILGTDIRLTAPGAYDALERHLDGHRYFLGQERGEPVAFEEAVRSWYERVYLPTVEVIRRTNIMSRFPGRTEGDLYLWVQEHHYYLREREGDGVSLEQAAQSFAHRYGVRWYHRAKAWVIGKVAQVLGVVVSWLRR
ncbi:MAG: hypothetical protein HPY83_18180 [Anaerolineae bacterium]|nr:hypothetical protein [Anaerolineae bacterium]